MKLVILLLAFTAVHANLHGYWRNPFRAPLMADPNMESFGQCKDLEYYNCDFCKLADSYDSRILGTKNWELQLVSSNSEFGTVYSSLHGKTYFTMKPNGGGEGIVMVTGMQISNDGCTILETIIFSGLESTSPENRRYGRRCVWQIENGVVNPSDECYGEREVVPPNPKNMIYLKLKWRIRHFGRNYYQFVLCANSSCLDKAGVWYLSNPNEEPIVKSIEGATTRITKY